MRVGGGDPVDADVEISSCCWVRILVCCWLSSRQEEDVCDDIPASVGVMSANPAARLMMPVLYIVVAVLGVLKGRVDDLLFSAQGPWCLKKKRQVYVGNMLLVC